MKTWTKVLFALFLSLVACGKKSDVVKLDKNTPAYALGIELASTLPIMDPELNRNIITTNDFQVSAGEVLQTLQSFMGNRTDELKRMPERRLAVFLKRTTNELVEKKLLLNAARRAKIKASSAAIDSILNQHYQRAGGKDVYLKFLGDSGIEFEFVKNDIKQSVIIQNYLDKIVRDNTRLTDQQIQDAYQRYLQDTTVSVRHILLITKDKTQPEKVEIRRKMEKILGRARRGDDFAALARQYSEDPGSRDKGGLYESFSRGDMIKPFEDAAFTVPVGEISGIVETEHGYHIIQVIQREKNNRPLEEVRDDLIKDIRRPEERNIIPDHIEALKKAANVRMADF
jgi:parvulin-like peptidyl-prolyl isomerase